MILNFEPVTLREHLDGWRYWRFRAAHQFCISAMPAKGNKDIMQAPVGWYIPRFIAGLRLGPRYVRRVKRELRRLSKV